MNFDPSAYQSPSYSLNSRATSRYDMKYVEISIKSATSHLILKIYYSIHVMLTIWLHKHAQEADNQSLLKCGDKNTCLLLR